MNKEELHIKAIDNANSRIKTVDRRCLAAIADYEFGLIQGFKDGAEWMLDNPTGGALLYAVNKTAERTKREVIEKAVEWIKSQMYIENIFEYDKDNQPVRYVCASCCDTVDDFIEKFKQVMKDEV